MDGEIADAGLVAFRPGKGERIGPFLRMEEEGARGRCRRGKRRRGILVDGAGDADMPEGCLEDRGQTGNGRQP